MEILINELSLSGQFDSIDHFIELGLRSFIKALNDIDFQTNLLYKKYDFYSTKITSQHTIHDTLIGTTSRQYDEIRKLKSQFAKLFDQPYWEDHIKHSANSVYLFNGKNICGFSLAEACERDKIVISFNHDDFRCVQLFISKGNNKIKLDNLFEFGHYTQIAYQRNLITFEEYCRKMFSKSKLNFSKIDAKQGFSLVKKDEELLFYKGFKKFSELSWAQIGADDGLRYKEYKGGFKNISEKIYEFRFSEKYRCFGYKKDDNFFVLRFELEHKLGN
jgi:hypothetical protein